MIREYEWDYWAVLFLSWHPKQLVLHPTRCLIFGHEEIPYFSSGTDPATSRPGSPFMIRQSRIYLLHDERWDRAVELMQELDAFSAEE